SLAIIPLERLEPSQKDPERPESVAQIKVPREASAQANVAAQLGRLLFHGTGDRRIARDGRACASCQPAGRADGLTWATPNGPRRTLMLAGRLQGTAPYGWDGKAKDVNEHLANTFDRLKGGGGLRSVELDALLAYLTSLPPPPAVSQGSDPE